VWANGREWLARQLDAKGAGNARYANRFVRIDRLGAAQALCLRLARRRWPRLLDDLARKVNPHLGTIRRAGFGGCWWRLDQAEAAADVMFASRPALEAVLADVLTHAATALSCGDVLRFLGRKLHPNLAAEVTASSRRRPEGVRVKHAFKRNSVKVCDKASVLRVETAINNPREFKVLRVVEGPDGRRRRRWMPMGKSVANAWRCFQVATAANGRCLDALAAAPLRGAGVDALDALCRPRTREGRRRPPPSPGAGRQRAVHSGPRRRARHRRVPQPRHHRPPLPTPGGDARGGTPSLPAHLPPDRQAPGPRPRRQGPRQSPLPGHALRPTNHVRGRQRQVCAIPRRPHRRLKLSRTAQVLRGKHMVNSPARQRLPELSGTAVRLISPQPPGRWRGGSRYRRDRR